MPPQDRSDNQDRTRQGIDRIVRELRNLASPTQEKPEAVDLAGAYDLVFQTIDALGPNSGLNAANVMRVRYCLSSATDNGLLHRQTQTVDDGGDAGGPVDRDLPRHGLDELRGGGRSRRQPLSGPEPAGLHVRRRRWPST